MKLMKMLNKNREHFVCEHFVCEHFVCEHFVVNILSWNHYICLCKCYILAEIYWCPCSNPYNFGFPACNWNRNAPFCAEMNAESNDILHDFIFKAPPKISGGW